MKKRGKEESAIALCMLGVVIGAVFGIIMMSVIDFMAVEVISREFVEVKRELEVERNRSGWYRGMLESYLDNETLRSEVRE